MARIELGNSMYNRVVKATLNPYGTTGAQYDTGISSSFLSISSESGAITAAKNSQLLVQSNYNVQTPYYSWSAIFICAGGQVDPETYYLRLVTSNPVSITPTSTPFDIPNRLICFPSSSWDGTAYVNFSNTIDVDKNLPVTITTQYVAAIASGTASSFVWIAGRSSSSSSANVLHVITGTVGLTGSGADLEIDNTTIISTIDYRILSLKIKFPYYWDY